MNRDNLDFLIPMFPFAHFSQFSILVINQTIPEKILESGYSSVRVINSFEKGLSKSRNLALENAKGSLCIISDDDVVFEPDFEDSILNAFNQNPAAGLISFRVKTPDGKLFKKYPSVRILSPNALQRMNIMSIEMVVNSKLVKGIRFNENFGLGATFIMGEETLFVNDIYKTQLPIIIENKAIVIHPEITTTQKTDIKEKYYVQGAFFTALFGNKYFKWLLLKLLFEIKQKNIKPSQVRIALKWAGEGRTDLLKIYENNNQRYKNNHTS